MFRRLYPSHPLLSMVVETWISDLIAANRHIEAAKLCVERNNNARACEILSVLGDEAESVIALLNNDPMET